MFTPNETPSVSVYTMNLHGIMLTSHGGDFSRLFMWNDESKETDLMAIISYDPRNITVDRIRRSNARKVWTKLLEEGWDRSKPLCLYAKDLDHTSQEIQTLFFDMLLENNKVRWSQT